MHFPSVAAALRHLYSPAGGSLKKLQHTQVTRAAKSNATRDGWAFTMENPSLVNPVVAAPSPSPTPLQLAARPQPLTPFFLAAVRCACCGINICGTKYTCNRCLQVVDEACMQVVGSTVHCFSCTCRACGNELPSHTVECHGCHFRMHPDCTTDGICTRCAERNPPRERAPKARKFNHAWLPTRPWLQYDAVCVLMWCAACRAYPQLGHPVPFVQGTSNFRVWTVQQHQQSGTHCVSVALWQSGGGVTSVIQSCLPTCYKASWHYSVLFIRLCNALVPLHILRGMPS